MTHLTDMIVRGTPVRFPDLEFVYQEAGLGWVPYMMRRLDNEYSEKREDAPMLEQMPSEYIRDQFYFTSQPVEGSKDSQYITSIVDLMGVNNLMFSSDYPHLDFDHSGELLRALRGSFTGEELNNVYGQTALDVYRF
jgi:predicted TIM-barrel fold metal-dependent hydrolase